MPYLAMADVRKRFGGVVALDGAGLEAEHGEVHALLGANGSGKSTLNKVLTGVVAPDSATIELAGQPLEIRNPSDAAAHGIAAVYQELSLVGPLSVADNIALAIEPTSAGFVRRAEVRDRAAEALAPFAAAFPGGEPPIDQPVAELSPSEQQLVEIAKALARRPDVLVLDEATASLRKAQVDVLFDVVRGLAAQGVLVVFVSHRMEEILDLCDRATILRGGRTVATVDLGDRTVDGDGGPTRRGVSETELVNLMIGEVAPHEREPRDLSAAEPVLLVRDLTTDVLHGISFDLRRGEVLGLGGLQGQGQSELLTALFGAGGITGGTVELDGRTVAWRSPRQAVRAGMAYVPGNRAREGLLPSRSILENLTLPSLRRRSRGGILPQRAERAAADAISRQLAVRHGGLGSLVSTLSGGNQQKVVVGKWLATEPKVVLLDDPTKGIDVGAKQELFTLIDELTAQGVGVLFNSSEDRELLANCDRVLVLYEGRLVDVLEGDALTEERLLAATLRVGETVEAGQS